MHKGIIKIQTYLYNKNPNTLKKKENAEKTKVLKDKNHWLKFLFSMAINNQDRKKYIYTHINIKYSCTVIKFRFKSVSSIKIHILNIKIVAKNKNNKRQRNRWLNFLFSMPINNEYIYIHTHINIKESYTMINEEHVNA